MSKEADASVLVLCISSLTDVNMFLTKNEDLFTSKVHSVTIMGGVETPEPGTEANAAIMLSPTISSASRSARKTPRSARGEHVQEAVEPPAQARGELRPACDLERLSFASALLTNVRRASSHST